MKRRENCLYFCLSDRITASWQRVSVSGSCWWPPLPLAAAGWGKRSTTVGNQGPHLPAWPWQSVPDPQEGTHHAAECLKINLEWQRTKALEQDINNWCSAHACCHLRLISLDICPGQIKIRADHLVTLIPTLSRSDVYVWCVFFSISVPVSQNALPHIVFREELAFQSASAQHCPPAGQGRHVGGHREAHTVTRHARSHLGIHKHTDAWGRKPYGGARKCERVFMQLSLMESVYLIVIWFVLTL